MKVRLEKTETLTFDGDFRTAQITTKRRNAGKKNRYNIET